MSAKVFAILGSVAEDWQGFFTTEQAKHVGVDRHQLSRLASAGALKRKDTGVYQMAGSPDIENEETFVQWLKLGGATLPRTDTGAPPVVAAGITAANIHGLGVYYNHQAEFVVPTPRKTNNQRVNLRALTLTLDETAHQQSMDVMTIERTIADLFDLDEDPFNIGIVVSDAINQHRLVHPEKLISYLDHVVTNGHGFGFGSGRALYRDLIERVTTNDGNLRQWAS